MTDDLHVAIAAARVELDRARRAVDAVALSIAGREGAEAGAAAMVARGWVWSAFDAAVAVFEHAAAQPMTEERRSAVLADLGTISAQLARLAERARAKLQPLES
jgi:hypothetical protein